MTSSSHSRNSTGVGLEKDIREKGEIQQGVFAPVEYPKIDVFSNAFSGCKAWQHKILTECAVTGRKYTFGQTYDGALRWGEALKKLLPKSRNSTIAFICTNSPDYVCLFLGTLAAGATVTPFNPIYTPDEVAHQLLDSGAELLVVDTFFEPIADAAFKIMGKTLPVVVNGVSKNGRPNAQEILADPNAKMLDYTPIDPNTVAFLPYSSGTTGRPKGVILTHEALVSNISMVANEHFGLHQKAFDYVLPNRPITTEIHGRKRFNYERGPSEDPFNHLRRCSPLD
ncbi:hypothetical protein Avbf_17107 [Armadillidium vulgare]|nr:hypothetical protein Avbf_17107 [Armadillidium vulgare]